MAHKKVQWNVVIQKANVVGPKNVALVPDNLVEQAKCLLWSDRFRNDLWVRRDPDKPALRHRACRPSPRRTLREPRVSISVVNMRWPRQCDKHVNIKQGLFHASSSARRTSSKVIGCAPVGTENTGKPEPRGALGTLGVALKPRRISSDTAAPRDTDLSRARLLAAARRSSSTVSVVLIPLRYNGDK